jgi:LysR family transcriptional regulator, regulator of abg operon
LAPINRANLKVALAASLDRGYFPDIERHGFNEPFMKQIRISQVKAFLAVAECGSIRSAAKRLGVSQPALTKAVRQLELELEVPLLQRTSRGAVVTEFGQALAPRAQIIEAELRLIREEMAQLRGAPASEVTIGLSAGASLLLSKALAGLWQRYPNARVRVVEGGHEATLAELRHGHLDFSIAPQELVAEPSDLTIEPLFETKIVPVVRKTHRLRKALSLKDLTKQGWVISGSRIASINILEATFAKYKLGQPKVAVQCESFPALVALLSETDLIGILPDHLVRVAGFQHMLQVIPVQEQFVPTQACLLTRPGTPSTPLAAALIREFRRAARAVDAKPEAGLRAS